MTPSLVIVSLVVLLAVAVLSALSRSLVQVSESALERTLAAHGRLERGRWIFGHLEQVEWAVAFLRTAGRTGFFALVLAVVVGIDEELTLGALAGAWLGSVVVIWLFTSVVGGALARYAPAEVIARFLPALRAMYLLLAPLRALADAVDGLIRRLARGRETEEERQEEELLSSIEDTQRTGAIDEVAATILENTIEFGDTTVGAVMTPRPKIEGIEYTDDLAAIREFIRTAGHSRIPVYRGNLDHVAGILYVKDLVPFLGRAADGFVLASILRQPMRVPESKPAHDQLIDFQREKVHLAIVVDEFGGTSGIVTIEDLLEELVGEIRDEHEPLSDAAPAIRRLDGSSVEASGRTPIGELNAALGLSIPEDEGFETVAGLVLARLGAIPQVGASFESDGARIRVTGATATAVLSVQVACLHGFKPSGGGAS